MHTFECTCTVCISALADAQTHTHSRTQTHTGMLLWSTGAHAVLNSAALNLCPQTLLPTPYSLLPTPYSLHLDPNPNPVLPSTGFSAQ
jgi:hypothetical protein